MGRSKPKTIIERSEAFKDMIERGLEKQKKADTLFAEVRIKVHELKELNIDTSDLDDVMKKARVKLQNVEDIDEYDIVISNLQKANQFIVDTRNKHKEAQDIISTAGNLMAEKTKKGIKIGDIEELIKKAQYEFKANDFQSAVDLANKCIDGVKECEVKHRKLKKLIESASSKIENAKNTGINVSKAENSLKKVRILKKKGEYDRAIGASKKIISNVTTLTEDYFKASNMIRIATEKISEAKIYDANTATAEEKLSLATARMESEDFVKAVSIAEESSKLAETAKNEQLNLFHDQGSKMISDLRDELHNTDKFGADVTNPKTIFDQLEIAFKNNDVKSTFENIELCKNAIADSRNQHQNALDKLESVRTVLDETNKSGADIANAEKILLKAEESLKSYDYGKVDAQANMAQEEAEKARESHRQMMGQREQAEDIIKNVKSLILETKQKGIIVTEADGVLTKAETSLAGSDFSAAQDLGKKAIEICKNLQNLFTQANENMQKAQTSINNSKMQLETTGAEEILARSKARMNEGNYSEASELAVKTINEIEKIKITGAPRITLKCSDIPAFSSSTWGKLQIEIENDGNVHANDIEIKIPDNFETMGLFTIKSLRAGENKILDVGLRTAEIGDIPVNVAVSFMQAITEENLETQQVFWIKNQEGVGEKKAEVPAAAAEPVSQPAPEGEVKVLSEVEFFQGFVRLKAGIKNDQNTVITDTKLDMEYDKDALRLDHIEPDLQRDGNKIIFGVIHPQEKRTIALYLDPQICTESFIDGNLTFKDIYGNLKTTTMKRRKAEVVCPILYTPENINTAMLKRLVNEELKIHDSKIYEIPPGLDFKKANDVCRETVQGHDLKFIREFIEHDIDDPEIESWFYGVTKVKKNKVIVKASTRRKTNTIELFVACGDKQVLTGFLAELGHNFNNKLKQLGITKKAIFPITDEATRETISQTTTLLQHQFLDKTTLSISKRGNEYEITFKASEEKGDAAELSEFIKVSPGSRTDLIAQINDIVTFLNIFSCTRGGEIKPEKKNVQWEDEKQVEWEDEDDDEEEVEVEVKVEADQKKEQQVLNREGLIADKMKNLISYGQLIYTMFLPVPIQKQLETTNEPIILKTNDNEIPWELLHDKKEFLSLKVPIGRKLRSREIPRSNQVDRGEKIRFLFIANATGDLKAAEDEVEYIKSHLSENVEIDVLIREKATSAAILSAFGSGKYDVIHYAGHAEFNANAPDESALISANHNKIFAQEIKRIVGGKPFVFLNACSSGKEKMCEDGESYTGSDTEGLASSFILGGALAFIGASWPLPDISAGILASEFYNQFLSGKTVGEALRLARIHLKNERPKDINWMAFTLYGDPTIKLVN